MVSTLVLASPLRAQTVDAISAHLTEAAQRFAVPEHWIRAVMRVESANNPRAVSPAGAMGLMQIMPATWRNLRNLHGLGSDPFDIRDNILAGAAYLSEMHRRYGSVALMLAAYNAGPGRADAHHATGRVLPAETLAYVARLMPMVGGDVVSSAAPLPPLDPRAATVFVQISTAQGLASRQTARTNTTALTADEAQFLALQSRSMMVPVRPARPQPDRTLTTAQTPMERRSTLLSFPAAPSEEQPLTDRLFAVVRSAGRAQ